MTAHPHQSTAAGDASAAVYERIVAGNDETAAAARQLLQEAVAQDASDIHLCTAQAPDGQQAVTADLRVADTLIRHATFTAAVGHAVMQRIQHAVCAGARSLPRGAVVDGRCDITIPSERDPGGLRYGLRCMAVPLLDGHQMNLRLLPRHRHLRTLEAVFPVSDSDIAGRIGRKLHPGGGIVVVAGGRSQGKSTTVAAALHHAARPERKVVSVEDPVETLIPGVQQVPITESLTFPDAVRALVRADPDLLMVSATRDGATARNVVAASQIGHSVLTAVEARSASHVVTRLTNMGIDPGQLVEELRLVVAQRLIRRRCSCMRLRGFVPEPDCSKCSGSGYAGRVALAETLVVDDDVAYAFASEAPRSALTKLDSYRTFEEHAAALIANQVTTEAEIERTLGDVPSPQLLNQGAAAAGGTGR